MSPFEAYVRPKRQNQPKMNFEAIGILPGETLNYIDDQRITVRVKGKWTVEYQGDEMSLMKATKLVRGVAYDIRGAKYWLWKGTLLFTLYEALNEKKKKR